MDRIFILSAIDADAFTELVALARRGRDDFLYQVRHGDYSPADVATADQTWARIEHLNAAMTDQLDDPDNAFAAALRDAFQALNESAYGAWEHFTCAEAERVANFCRAAGRHDVADAIISDHADGDEEGDRHHDGCDECGAAPLEPCLPFCLALQPYLTTS